MDVKLCTAYKYRYSVQTKKQAQTVLALFVVCVLNANCNGKEYKSNGERHK